MNDVQGKKEFCFPYLNLLLSSLILSTIILIYDRLLEGKQALWVNVPALYSLESQFADRVAIQLKTLPLVHQQCR